MKRITLLLSLPILFSLVGCNDYVDTSKTIYTSFYPVYEFTKRIVGDKYHVVSLVPPGSEPHDFELTARQVARIYDSKALFINGLDMEVWSSSLDSHIKKKTYVLSNGIETRKEGGITDPHIWLDPLKAIEEMRNVTTYMSQIDSENASFYETNFILARNEFLQLDEELAGICASFSNKNVLVNHAAFGYMCDRYNLNQISVNGLEPSATPGPKTIVDIINKVNEYHVNTIFTEELSSPEVSELIARECGIKTDTLNPLEGLQQDEIDAGEDYISVMKDNFIRLKEACK